MSDEALLAELADIRQDAGDDITRLTHVRPYHAPEFIAERQPCRDFDLFAPLFAAVRRDLQDGVRAAKPFKKDAGIRVRIEQGDFFILSGQMAYVAAVGEIFENQSGHEDARLRVIFDNRTESAMLRRSLQRALYKDDGGRRIAMRGDDGALFGDSAEDEDVASGTIYVLRSLSTDAYIAKNRELIHKIGVTGGEVKTRIAHAGHDATFLLADVEIVAEYRLANINPWRLEKLLHQVFAAAQLDIAISDRFGNPVQPKEWFLVPLPMIHEAVQRIRDGSITKVRYDPASAAFV
ncbi:GIY-YIG nuclease family protein [uncultured Cardiobacterium sp.]|uniref:GIY-YIG nuclease family protein n=1 Tax=uncultured Cardiobacterium sp. TaxID=417619 RepID=UPI002610827D|nr:GIY-YIG nuclease family protein [uncultured Cardiobacterium sp.]